ncbi:unnamed protein product [Vicia faba]|uniref:Glycosyltransferase n=1 Tax=Vicia faba TaxID=3906 RepID=A0AAV0Z1C2_VICFA|nr:unnamed protein product [Vicia faba]
MTISSEKKHVAVYVFPFGSHPVVLLNLVLKLAHASPDILFSFIGTQQSNQPFFTKPNIPNSVKFYSIHDGVPEGHVLGSHPVEKVDLFLQAAQKLNVPWIPVWPPLSCSLSAHFYTHLIRRKCAENNAKDRSLDFLPGLSKMRVGDLPDDIINCGEDETLFSKTLASYGEVLPKAKAVVMNFFEELDLPLFVEDMRSKLQNMLYVGFLTLSIPLPPLPPSESDETGCLSWLDKQKGESVIYVSFGTTVTPPPHELVALAEALEESGFPFLWSLKDNLKGVLPQGFVERTSNIGKIVPWVPQTQVLGHDSVGVFVTHSGCNSVYESICNGVPLICRPFFGDHVMTARMVEDIWEIGVKMEGGVFTKNGLLKSLNLILVKEEGKKMRENAQKVKKTVLDVAGPNGKAVQDFKTLVELICH